MSRSEVESLRRTRAIDAIQRAVDDLLNKHWHEVEEAWGRCEDECPKVGLALGVTLSDSLDAPSVVVKLGFGIKIKDEVEIRLDDPRQGHLPLDGRGGR